jgi:hypothetical protein
MIMTRRTVLWSVVVVLAAAVVTGTVGAQGRGMAIDRPAPEIVGGPWINSEALRPEALRGRVLFVEFWTYG